MKRGLGRLEGVEKVEISDFDRGEVNITCKEKAKVAFADVKKALGRFELKELFFEGLPGTVEEKEMAGKDVIVFKTAGGLEFILEPPKNQEEALKAMFQEVKDGKFTFRVEGALTQNKEKQDILVVTGAKYWEPKKKDK